MLFDEEKRVLVRVSDVVAGVIAGAICAVLAAAFEVGVVSLRFFSIAHVGDHFGDPVLVLALVGATIGGIVGASVGILFHRPKAPSQAG